MSNTKTIALADDHILLRDGLAGLVTKLGYEVLFQADNGQDLMNKVAEGAIPDLVLMDINMPIKDGYETTSWLKKYYPDVKVLALSMYDDEHAIIRMLRSGARGYILKDSEPSELRAALEAILHKGFHYSDMVTGKLLHSIHQMDEEEGSASPLQGLNPREEEFLKYASTEMTYKEIADRMNLSPRTIDGYRDSLFEKLGLKSRVGLVLFAIKHGIVRI
ncbi:MAG: response regulator transcription factor [Chitinophagaceae bacterium]|nr:response regulator transcription factor [Chitinophagaceae bacterium]